MNHNRLMVSLVGKLKPSTWLWRQLLGSKDVNLTPIDFPLQTQDMEQAARSIVSLLDGKPYKAKTDGVEFDGHIYARIKLRIRQVSSVGRAAPL